MPVHATYGIVGAGLESNTLWDLVVGASLELHTLKGLVGFRISVYFHLFSASYYSEGTWVRDILGISSSFQQPLSLFTSK